MSCFNLPMRCVRSSKTVMLCISLLFSAGCWAEKVSLDGFCLALAGHWRGEASRPNGRIKAVTLQAICSADRRQLILTVSEHASHPLSETWWFRQEQDQVKLTYFNGVDSDRQQYFTLYHNDGSFSLLGKGQVKQRPALIQLQFERRQTGWLWLQNVQYLDQDEDGYQLYRGIAFTPAAAQ